MTTTFLDNGVEVSIITDGYGREYGLYEVAAFKNGRCVTRSIRKGCPNVIGWLDYTEALTFLNDAKKIYRR